MHVAASSRRMHEPVLCIGHSHVTAIERALQAAVPPRPVRLLNFWNLPGAIVHADGAPRFSEALRGELATHRGPVFSLIGGAAHTVLGMLVHPQRFDFVLASEPDVELDPRARLLPVSLVRRLLEPLMADYLTLMGEVRAACHGPVFHLEPPPPCADHRRMKADMPWELYPGMCREIAPPAFRYKLWRLHSELLRAWCVRHAVTLLPCPVRAIDGGFMRDDCYGDGAHANAAYGQLLLEQMDAAA